jgi:hypothetical protein
MGSAIENQSYRVTSKVSTEQLADTTLPAQLPEGPAPNSRQETRPHDVSHSAPYMNNGQLASCDNIRFDCLNEDIKTGQTVTSGT